MIFQRKQNRREFFRSVGRYLMLGGLASTAGILVKRGRGNSETKASIDVSACYECSFLKRCDQPNAISARKEEAIG